MCYYFVEEVEIDTSVILLHLFFCKVRQFLFAKKEPALMHPPSFKEEEQKGEEERENDIHLSFSLFFFLFREMISGQKGKRRKGKTF